MNRDNWIDFAWFVIALVVGFVIMVGMTVILSELGFLPRGV